MKIAIIGSGISGLTAAYLLAPNFDITLYEANDYLGGHTNTIEVQRGEERLNIDTGFIVYNERTYPNFISLLEELNVSTQETTMGFSVRCHQSNLEYSGESIAGLIADKRNLLKPRFYQMLRDIVRFYRHTREFLQSDEADKEITVAEFARRHRYSKAFVDYHLLPMGAAIWSCNLKSFGEFPFQFVAEFYDHHGLIQLGNRPQWRVIQGGSKEYIAPIIKQFSQHIRLQDPVQKVHRLENVVRVDTRSDSAEYDHVIMACHSDTSLLLLDRPDATELEVLQCFPYTENQAVLHTDESVLPRSRKAWASWNYALHPNLCEVPTLTYNMNILQRLQTSETYCVTLNSKVLIDPDSILREITYEHPLFTVKRKAAQQRHGELIGRNGISYCGAYWRNGFHEDGVVSALRVCQQWGIQPDWAVL